VKLSTAIRRAPTMLRSALRDLRHGRPLGGTVPTRYEHVGAYHSTNSPYDDLDRVFAGVEIGPGDTIVDVGCGKGRSLNWLVEHFPENAIVGIELDPEICAATAKRLRREQNVTVICGDAIDRLPAEGTVFYLFNPFDEMVMDRFVAALLARGTPATVVYYNAKHLAPFSAEPRFEVAEIDDPALDHRSAIVTLR
jgi:SAM-dependent methyltransferase